MIPGFPLENSSGPGCSLPVEQYLERLAQWRTANKAQTYGVWKLLTDCYPPPGTIGIAYVGNIKSHHSKNL